MKLSAPESDFSSEKRLITAFNQRSDQAFCAVYTLFYDGLYYFTARLLDNSPNIPSDIIHDIFMKLWEHRSTRFEDLHALKGYLYVAVRNRIRDLASRSQTAEAYRKRVLSDEGVFADSVETHVLEMLSEAIELLPDDASQVLRMCIEGWDIKEIAGKTGLPTSTVYARKQRGVNLLKKHFSKETLMMIGL